MAYTTIDDPTIYFNTKLYTGTGSSQAITGVGFQPDWVWAKQRNEARAHSLYDVVRGVQKQLKTEGNDVETTAATFLTAFDSDGFTMGGSDNVNGSSKNYVAWCWNAGGSASSNSDGTVTTSVSSNTTAGFSIVSYTGTQSAATFGHGLGAVPGMLIIKNRNSTDNRDWAVYHKKLSGNNKYLSLNLNSAELTDAATFNNTAPTSTVFSSASSVEVNESSKTFIAYCFTEIKGYSSMRSYTGNGNSDGPMIYTGFRPAWFMVKNTAASEHWRIYDNKRDTFNQMYHVLFPNENSAESTVDNGSEEIDFLSNGVKIKSSAAQLNGNGQTLIYMAFAESPFVNSNGVPNNAR